MHVHPTPRRGNKLAPALCAAAAFERDNRRAPTAADVPAIVAALPAQEKAHGVKAGFVPPAAVEDFVGAGYEMPAISSLVGGMLGQELLKSVTGRGEPIRNLFVFSLNGGMGCIENLGCDKGR